MPRACLPNALNGTNLLFLILPPFPAFVVNHLLVHTVALVAMFILLRSYCPSNGPLMNASISFGFSVLPFYSLFSLSIAGQPLVLYAMLQILSRRDRPADYLILWGFPFVSSLPLVGTFILVCAGGLWIADVLLNKRFNTRFLVAVGVMAILYCVCEYQLVYAFTHDSFTSHRTEWNFHSQSAGLRECVRRALGNVLSGQYHAASLHRLILTLAIPAGVLSAWLTRDRRTLVTLVVILAVCLAFSIALGFQGYRGLIPVKERVPFLAIWQFGRFHWLHPTLWYFAFGLSTVAISRLDPGGLGVGKGVAFLLVFTQLLYVLVQNVEFTDTVRGLHSRATGRVDDRLSYSRFYSQPLFQKIESAIGRPKHTYRVVSIGMHPGVAIYNGFHCLDFYSTNYPLSYKHSFRRIIEEELRKEDSKWREYYDGWGSRCYVFVEEVGGFVTTKDHNARVEHLALNTRIFKGMGGVYIFSAVEIVNHEENDLRYEGVFQDADSPWRIYLYRAE